MRKCKLLLALLLVSLAVAAQPPQQFSFQAVLRGNSGNLVVNEQIDVRIRLLYGEKTPQEVYVETHSVKTNSQGVFALSVGAGNVEKGNLKQALSRIDLDTLYLQPEVKRNGAVDFVALPAQRMFASPYATYAPTANKADIIPYSESVFATQSYAGSVNIRNEIGRGSDTVFCVKNRAGQPVFTVFDDGVAVGITKEGSFTIYDVNSGAQLFTIDHEKIHMSINDTAFVEQKTGRPQKASFAVGGMAGRAGQSNYLTVEPDATNFNFVENYNTVGRPQKASFAVGGIAGLGRDKQHNIYLSAGDEGFRFAFKEYKEQPEKVGFVVNSGSKPVLEIGSSHTTVYVPEDDPSSGRPQKASFAVGGMAGRADASEGYFNISPTWASVNSVNQGKDQITNQLVSGFDVGGISSEVQDYTSYISVASDGTTANQLASKGDATYVREVKANYDPNVVKDANGDWYYGITKVGNYRWLKTNLRGGNTEQDSLNGTFYANGIGTCPDGWHLANKKDWESLINYTTNTYGVTSAQITPEFLEEKYKLYFPPTSSKYPYNLGEGSSYPSVAIFNCDNEGWLYTISSDGIIGSEGGGGNLNGEELTARCVEGGRTPDVAAIYPPEKVMAQSAVLTARIDNNGNMPLIDYGFKVYCSEGDYQFDTTCSCKGGPFRYELSGLRERTSYNVRAYAENNLGEFIEGNGINFDTKERPSILNVESGDSLHGLWYKFNLACSSACLKIVRYGVCYVTGETPQDQISPQQSQLKPTILNTCIDGDVTNPYASVKFYIPGTPGRTTYVRPFAILENNDVVYGGDEYIKSFATAPLPEISIKQKSIEWWGIEPTLSIIYDANIYIDGDMTNVVVRNADPDPQKDTVINVFEWNQENKLEAILPVLIPADHNFTEPYTLNFYLEVREYDRETQDWKSIAKSAPERFVFSGVKVETLPLSGHGSDNQSSSAMASTFTRIVGNLATFFIGQKFGGNSDKYIRVKYGPVGTNEEFVITNPNHVYCDDYCHFDYNARIAGLKPATEYWVQPEVIVRKYTDNTYTDSVILTGARQTFTTEPMGEVRTATNTYKTVVLDNVEWMAENLRETDGLKKAKGITDPLFETDTAYFEAKDKNGGIEIIYNMMAVKEKDLCSMLGEGWMLPGIYVMQSQGQFSDALSEVANSYYPQDNFGAPAVVLRDTTMWDSQPDVTGGKIELPEGLPNNPLLFGLKQVEITHQIQGQTGPQDVTSKGAWLWAGSNGGYMPFIIVQEVIEEKKGNIGSIRCVRYLDKH